MTGNRDTTAQDRLPAGGARRDHEDAAAEAEALDRSLRELIALFWRYQGPLPQLAQFDTPSSREWFKEPAAYWYR
jgi:hypothetical protein